VFLVCNKNDQYSLLSTLYNVSLWRRTNHSHVWSVINNTISYQHKLGGKDEAIRATSMVLTLSWWIAGRQGMRIIHQHHPRALVARKRFYMYHYLFITMNTIIINAVIIHKYGRNCLLDGGRSFTVGPRFIQAWRLDAAAQLSRPATANHMWATQELLVFGTANTNCLVFT